MQRTILRAIIISSFAAGVHAGPVLAGDDSCDRPPPHNGLDFAVPCKLLGPLAWPESQTFFDKGSAALTPAAMAGLDHQAEVLRGYPRLLIDLVGYTDWSVEAVTPEDNLALGLKRAMAVRTYLVAKGIDPDLISTRASKGPNLVARPGDQAALAYARFVLTVTHE